jgi:hypothetical protein
MCLSLSMYIALLAEQPCQLLVAKCQELLEVVERSDRSSPRKCLQRPYGSSVFADLPGMRREVAHCSIELLGTPLDKRAQGLGKISRTNQCFGDVDRVGGTGEEPIEWGIKPPLIRMRDLLVEAIQGRFVTFVVEQVRQLVIVWPKLLEWPSAKDEAPEMLGKGVVVGFERSYERHIIIRHALAMNGNLRTTCIASDAWEPTCAALPEIGIGGNAALLQCCAPSRAVVLRIFNDCRNNFGGAETTRRAWSCVPA